MECDLEVIPKQTLKFFRVDLFDKLGRRNVPGLEKTFVSQCPIIGRSRQNSQIKTVQLHEKIFEKPKATIWNKTPAKHRNNFRDTLLAKKNMSMAKERFGHTTYWQGNKKIQASARVRTQALQPD